MSAQELREVDEILELIEDVDEKMAFLKSKHPGVYTTALKATGKLN